MSVRLLVPAPDAEPWPSLGGHVCDWIEERLVHGPGDVLGEPVDLTDEMRLFLWRAYELYPRGHELEGRRRFKRATFSRRKGAAKTELAAWLAIAELDDEAPVRFDGWDAKGDPVGRGLRDPYIPMMAVTEEQSSDLAYGAAVAILERCELGNKYLVGVEEIKPRALSARGLMRAMASAPSARDGARTTFQHFDEPHHFTSSRLKLAVAMMERNVPKRAGADAWSLYTTTMYAPGEDSVAEDVHKYAQAVEAGQVEDPRLLFDHLQAAESHKLDTAGGLKAAIVEASGDAIGWTDVDAIAAQFRDPTVDKNELRRYWLNQPRRSSRRWLAEDVVEARVAPRVVPDGTEVVLAFDGSYARDSTALIGATVEARPYVFVVELWERPPNAARWRTPRLAVEDAIEAALERWTVLELAPDPPGWHREIEDWEDTYGETVVRFETNQPSRMGPATDAFEQAIRGEGDPDDSNAERIFGLELDGDARLLRHIGNAIAVKRGPHVLIRKESHDSPLKIDAAVGAIVAYDRARWHYANRDLDEDLGAIVVSTRPPAR